MQGQATVVHVDDDPRVLSLSRRVLSSDDDDREIETAETAAEGLDLVESREVDCLVSDSVRLPDGEPLVAAARQTAPEVPIVVFTGSEESEEAVHADAYVRKGDPDDFQTVATAVEELLDEQPLPDGWTVVARHAWDGPFELGTTIVRAAAAVRGEEASPDDLPPLYGAIDPDALVDLLDPGRSGSTSVTFAYDGRTFRVTDRGVVGVK
jgi:CheY-like chemotaxis protein